MPKASEALKIPPYDLEAERSVLGAILIDPSAITLAAEFLKPEHFYDPNHKLIFAAMLSLFEKQQPIDIVTLINQLKTEGNLKKLVEKVIYQILLTQFPPQPILRSMV